ncbi:hypothetical protein [Stecheria intestinalis]|uniref:hypothetical protein n=1 Tax=Stecheria intestinalis TaxID=2606630 RepID=UPI00197DB381|nr:hypothetical protein [Stecheria intestinalis]
MIDPRTTIHEFMVSHQKKYQKISMEIHEHPEGSDFEFLASKLLSEQLKEKEFEIDLPAARHRTGFAARKRFPEE